MNQPLHIGMVAGEASGDALGEALILELARHFPGLRVSGVGGQRMIAAGMESLYDIERLSVMGFVEPLKRLPELLRMRRELVQHFCAAPVDLFVGIDAPDFNLGLAKRVHRQGIKTAQYVSPSVWAWRQGRVKGIRQSIDLMLTLFPFESRFYQREGVPVAFVGHPFAQKYAQPLAQFDARAALGLPGEGRLIALMPGSRRGEVELLLPLFLQTAQLLRQRLGQVDFVIPAASPPLLRYIRAQLADTDVHLVEGRAAEVIAAADAVLVASGTSTLEIMLLDRPMVVAYRLGWLTYQIARHLVRTPFIAIPNLLAGRLLVPEHIQDDLDPARLAESLAGLLENPSLASAQRQAFAEQRHQLGGDSAAAAARALAQLVGTPQ